MWCRDSLSDDGSHLEQTFFFTQMFVDLLVKVVQSLLHLFARILFDNLA